MFKKKKKKKKRRERERERMGGGGGGGGWTPPHPHKPFLPHPSSLPYHLGGWVVWRPPRGSLPTFCGWVNPVTQTLELPARNLTSLGKCLGWSARCQYTVTGWDSKIDLQLRSECGTAVDYQTRSVPETDLHVIVCDVQQPIIFLAIVPRRIRYTKQKPKTKTNKQTTPPPQKKKQNKKPKKQTHTQKNESNERKKNRPKQVNKQNS